MHSSSGVHAWRVHSSPAQVLSVFIGGLPGYIFCSTYVMLGLFWAYLYYCAHSDRKDLKMLFIRIYIVFNSIQWTVWFVLLLLIAATSHSVSVVRMLVCTPRVFTPICARTLRYRCSRGLGASDLVVCRAW